MENKREYINCDIEAVEAVKGTHFYEKWFSEDQLSYTVQGKQEWVEFPPFEALSSVATELARRNPNIARCDIILVLRNANKMGGIHPWDIITINLQTLTPVINSAVESDCAVNPSELQPIGPDGKPMNITRKRVEGPVEPKTDRRTPNLYDINPGNAVKIPNLYDATKDNSR